MYFWKQGRFVQCSSEHPEDTKADEDKGRTVNKNTNSNRSARSNNRYGYNNSGRSMKEWEREILGEFEDWLSKEE